MNDIQYVGERLWAGQLGSILILLAFGAGLLSTISYAFGTNEKDLNKQTSWLSMGRWAFAIHGIAIFSIIFLIFFMMLNRYYEYEYVWAHISNSLPFKYTFSAFWEGQEGSFLLWMFWHVVLGFILMWKAKEWEMPVMTSVALVQTLLVSMLLGIYVTDGDGRIGSNPFVLLRDMNFAPIFSTPTYLTNLEGKGLNVLLQNYWMTIHPPTLFLGFASTIVPFAYAVAGLWKGQHTEWLRPALPWALFSAAILGTGILMGGAWAYEALSFGGYWAWDPVENASLVPWIVLVAGIHTAVVAKNTGYSIKSTYIFFILTFLLIVYSTFLTRSGILGETSVHSFTEMGLEWQLVIFMAITSILGFGMYFKKSGSIPVIEKEEGTYTREFWMFIGALVLLFSAGLITFTTSIPVFNTILAALGIDYKLAPPEDVVDHHNRFQLWIGILVAVLSGIAQFLRYKKDYEISKTQFWLGIGLGASFIALALVATLTNGGAFLSSKSIIFVFPLLIIKPIRISALISIVLSAFVLWSSGIEAWQYWLLVWAGIFGIFANLDYVIRVLRGNIKVAAAPVAHIGFGILMIGAVYSGALKTAISVGFTSVDDVLNDLNKQTTKNVLLVKNTKTSIQGGFEVTFTDEWEEGNAHFFKLEFERKDKDGKLIEQFTTTPNVLKNKNPDGSDKFAAANPNTRHYLSQDIFTLAVPNWAFQDPNEKPKADTATWKQHQIKQGDTIFTSRNYIIFEGLEKNIPATSEYKAQDGDIAVAAKLNIRAMDTTLSTIAQPIYYIRGTSQFDIPATHKNLGLTLRLSRILPTENKVQIEVLDNQPKQDYVVMQAIIFPMINFVWLGSIMMMIGLLMGMWQRGKG